MKSNSILTHHFHTSAGLTLQVVAGNKLQHLIQEDDGEREFEHNHPLLHVQVSQLEDHLEGVETRHVRYFTIKNKNTFCSNGEL